MKILVVDDSQEQIDAAIMTLKGHNLTFASTAKEAAKLLEVKFEEMKFLSLLKEAAFPDGYDWEKYDQELDSEKKKCYKTLIEECSIKPDFDVVLTDLLMPGEEEGLSPQSQNLVGKLTPYGFGIALLALKNKVGKVAIVSLGDHHSHPILWFCDQINDEILSGFKVYTFLTETIPGKKLKDWGKALADLLKE